MKIFSVYNNYVSDASLTPADEPLIYTVPDTALLKDDRPFFIPSFASPCTYQASLVLRIGRLGRSISPRFAHRYIDAMTVGVAFTARNLWEKQCANGWPWDTSKGFDGAAVIGRFLPIGAEDTLVRSFRLDDDGQTRQKYDGLPAARYSAEQLVAYISRYYLLRQGDLLYLGFPCAPVEAAEDHLIEAWLGTERLLAFHIK
jgi:2-keto-4-pentenoate hydratase/2-oxohepta-3-ene-1,7-dioic acid hydratase in catechol pathway